MLTETYILYTYAQRLEDTPPFNPEMESVVLGVGFVQWKKDTNDFLVRLGQFSNDFRKNSTDSTRIIRTYLIAFKKAANVGHLPYHLDMYCMGQRQRAGFLIIIHFLTYSLVFLPKFPCRYSRS